MGSHSISGRKLAIQQSVCFVQDQVVSADKHRIDALAQLFLTVRQRARRNLVMDGLVTCVTLS
jgi:hypothetical protein